MGRGGSAGRAVGAALVAVLVMTAPAGAAARHRPTHRSHRAPAVTLAPLDTTAAPILRLRVIGVRVRARRAMTVRLYASAVPAGGTLASVITRSRVVRLRAGRPLVVRLRTITAARAALRAPCPPSLSVTAVTLRGRHRVPGRRYVARRRLRGGPARCRRLGSGGTAADFGAGLLAWNPRQGGANDPVFNPSQGEGACDPNDPSVCLQPWPNDFFTTTDSTTDTGRRVDLQLQSMPTNRAGKPIDPSDINRNDGFSPDAPIVVKVPGLDTDQAFARTGAVNLRDLSRAFDDAQPVVLINTRTLQRQLVWSEIDSSPADNPSDPSTRVLMIHPGVNLQENTRYIVALRNLRDAAGNVIPATGPFKALRDGTSSSDPTVAQRRKHYEALFNALAAAGVDRDSLYLAWDFTVASERSLSERQLSIRDDAFKALGDTNLSDLQVQGSSPAFKVTKVTDNVNSQIARRVEGTYTVPCYLNLPGCPSGSRFLYPPGSTHGPPMPLPGNTETARFTCNIPWVALHSGGARPSLYGHGLFGSRDEVNQGQAQAMDQEHDFMYCATDWVGMACTDLNAPPTPGAPSSPADLIGLPGALQSYFTNAQAYNPPDCDVPTALGAESDLSNFPTLVDRLDQAFVNFMYLGRLMIHAQGFSSNPAFHGDSGQSVIDTRRLFYDGNSQGGIFGGSLIALEPDLDRGVIGVTGESYSVLLQRSTDFGNGSPPSPNPSDPTSVIPEYAYPLYQAYPNIGERQLILSLIQQMWDHSDPGGLAAHMTTRPLPNTPVHHVLMHIGLGDHQVSNYAAEMEARTIGAYARTPWADSGRYYETGSPIYGIPPIPAYPFDGSAIVTWDIGPIRKPDGTCQVENNVCGTNPDPIENAAPSSGVDPHEAPRNQPQARAQKAEFLSIGGKVIDTCGPRPCYAFGWRGP